MQLEFCSIIVVESGNVVKKFAFPKECPHPQRRQKIRPRLKNLHISGTDCWSALFQIDK